MELQLFILFEIIKSKNQHIYNMLWQYPAIFPEGSRCLEDKD